MRVLVIGASGQVGKRLVSNLRPRHEVIETGYANVAGGLVRLNLGVPEDVEALIGDVRPEVIVNTLLAES